MFRLPQTTKCLAQAHNGKKWGNKELKTAAYSPWSNGLIERHNQTLTEIGMKIKASNGCDQQTALDKEHPAMFMVTVLVSWRLDRIQTCPLC